MTNAVEKDTWGSRARLYAVVGCLSLLILSLVSLGACVASVPTDHRAIGRIELDLAPELVWATIIERSFQERSNDELGAGIVVLDEAGDVVETRPSEYRVETSASGTPMTCTVSFEDNALWQKSWTWKVESVQGGSRVTLEEHVVIRSILTRVFVALQRSDRSELKYIEVDRFLRSLAQTHGVDATPVHIE